MENDSDDEWEFSRTAVNKARKVTGGKPLVAGVIPCLCCGEPFKSWDKLKNRLCENCGEKEESTEFPILGL